MFTLLWWLYNKPSLLVDLNVETDQSLSSHYELDQVQSTTHVQLLGNI